MMDDYDIVVSLSAVTLVTDIKGCMRNGWSPLGGPFVDFQGRWCQAIVRKYEPLTSVRISELEAAADMSLEEFHDLDTVAQHTDTTG